MSPSFVSKCLPFRKCCSGAERAVDNGRGEMAGTVSDHVCFPCVRVCTPSIHMYVEGESPTSGV